MPVPERRPQVLLADTEISEDHVEDIFDVDAAGEAAKRLRSQAQLLGQQILALGHWPTGGPAERGDHVFQRPPVAGTGDQCRLGAGQKSARMALQRAQKPGNTSAGLSRNIELRFTHMTF